MKSNIFQLRLYRVFGEVVLLVLDIVVSYYKWYSEVLWTENLQKKIKRFGH